MKARQVATTGMLAAMAFLLMAAIQVPVLPQAPFLTYDPSDAVGLLAALLYGPASGLTVVLLKDLLFLLLRAQGPFGPVADFIAAGTFVAVTATAFRRRSGAVAPRLLESAVLGASARVAVMIPVNFVILALQFGMPASRVAALLVPAIIPFNAIKAGLNAVIALLIAEPVMRRASRVPSR
jgi:riboflavin transporter FmnP